MNNNNTELLSGLTETSKKILYGGTSKISTPEKLGYHKKTGGGLLVNIPLILLILLLISFSYKLYQEIQSIDQKLIDQQGEEKSKEEFIDFNKIINNGKSNITKQYNKLTNNIKYIYKDDSNNELELDILPIDVEVDRNLPDDGEKPFESESRVQFKHNILSEPKVKGFKSDMGINILEVESLMN